MVPFTSLLSMKTVGEKPKGFLPIVHRRNVGEPEIDGFGSA